MWDCTLPKDLICRLNGPIRPRTRGQLKAIEQPREKQTASSHVGEYTYCDTLIVVYFQRDAGR